MGSWWLWQFRSDERCLGESREVDRDVGKRGKVESGEVKMSRFSRKK